MTKSDCSTYAVSLSFDASFSSSLSSLVQSFACVTGNSTLLEKNAPVHLTLGMFHVPDGKILELKRLFEEFCASVKKGSTLDFCGTDSFKQKVIFLSIDKASSSFEMLKKLNVHLHDLFLPHFEAGANRNYLPEVFFPHVALAVKLSPEQFEKGINWAHPPASAEIQAVSLARCHPYEEIARH